MRLVRNAVTLIGGVMRVTLNEFSSNKQIEGPETAAIFYSRS